MSAGVPAVLSRLSRMPAEERRTMGLAGRARVASCFPIRSFVAAHDALYRQVTGAQDGGRLAAE